jgi:hypothetical protein
MLGERCDVQLRQRRHVPGAFRFALILLIATTSGVRAQPVGGEGVEVSPLECWWRTSSSSIRVGETFTIRLTCAALETDAARTVVDRSRLAPASVQLPPFEILGGTQSADHVTPGRRYLQYEYRARLIAQEGFGSDVVIPPLIVGYRIESRVADNSAIAGREQTYELPALVMRLQSLVPAGAGHIRESGVPSLDAIAAREFRARLFGVIAIVLFAASVLTLALGLVRWRRQVHPLPHQSRVLLPERRIIAAARRELAAMVRNRPARDWDEGTVTRALAAARVLGSLAAGRPVAQREVETAEEGEIAVHAGLFGRRTVALSGAATPAVIRSAGGYDDLAEAIETLTASRYAPRGTVDAEGLDSAVEAARRAGTRLAAARRWDREMARAAARMLRGWTPRAWAR